TSAPFLRARKSRPFRPAGRETGQAVGGAWGDPSPPERSLGQLVPHATELQQRALIGPSAPPPWRGGKARPLPAWLFLGRRCVRILAFVFHVRKRRGTGNAGDRPSGRHRLLLVFGNGRHALFAGV